MNKHDHNTQGENPLSKPKRTEEILSALEERKETRASDNPSMPVRHLMIFTLCNERYAIDIKYLTRVIWAKGITPVPDVPSHIVGIINLRGEIVSVVDLKPILSLEEEDTSNDSPGAIIVTSSKNIEVGFLVDQIDDIIELPINSIDPPMIIFEKKYAEFIDGEAMIDERLLAILNYENIMTSGKMKVRL